MSSPEVPDNAQIVLFKDYCRQLGDTEYQTNVSGIIQVPGKRTLKNRTLIASAKRVFKGRGWDSHKVVEKGNENIDPSLPFTNYMTPDDVAAERLSWVTSKAVSDSLLRIDVCPPYPERSFVVHYAHSDEHGMFSLTVSSPFAPVGVVVSSEANYKVSQRTFVSTIAPEGVSIISDFDDTVRQSGLLEGPRKSMRDILWNPFGACHLEGVSDWYRGLNCPVHYVSNSPWQMYHTVRGFIKEDEFPVASIHLAKYEGDNRKVLDALTSSSSEKRGEVLNRILRDFPARKFVLIGNSAERDLEVYARLASAYPSQIVAIYIRAIPICFSDPKTSLGQEEKNVANLQEILDSRESPQTGLRSISAPVFNYFQMGKDMPDMFGDLYDKARREYSSPGLPILDEVLSSPPKTPLPLSPGETTSFSVTPPLPYIEDLPSVVLTISRPRESVELPERPESTSERLLRKFMTPVSVGDTKMKAWTKRVESVAKVVPASIQFKFWWTPEEVVEECFGLMKR